MKPQHTADVLIVGAGAAGLAAALRIADRTRVLVLSKDGIEGGSTNRAQGGIAAVMHPRDSVARHVRDTIQAGAGLCDARSSSSSSSAVRTPSGGCWSTASPWTGKARTST